MAQTIVNAAPMVVNLGTNDKSTVQVPIAAEQIPQHLPVFFLFTQRGAGRSLVDGNAANQIYGELSFDPRSDYYNHATAFFNEAIAQGNSCMLERLVPTDAGPKANAVLWLDVLETTVDRYQRNPDGSIALDEFGDPTIIGTAPGLKSKWVKTNRATVSDQENFGSETQAAGDQTDTNTSTQSVRYPIFEIEETGYGADGNNTGFRLWAPTATGGNSLPTKMMNQYQIYPYMFAVIERENENATPKLDPTIQGETSVMFTFKSGVVNPATEQALGWDVRIVNAYNQIDVPGYPDIYGRIGRFFVYEDNVDVVTQLMYQYESDFINSNSDITEDPASHGLMNFVTGVSSANVPYETYIFVDSVTSVRMSDSSNVYLEGGSDGTMSNEMFETLVNAAMDRYADVQDSVQDIAVNVESVIYDSGFSLDTKFKLAQFISVRKDTVVIMGTHTVDEPKLTESEEHSVAVSIRTRLQMFPESTYFGTGVTRAMIMGRSGVIRNSEYTKRVPATFELINKFSRYMGAGNGAWKSGSSPSAAPGSIVQRLKDLNITWISENVRNQNWDVGLNWVQHYNRSQYFIPAYKTVYADDTSVLNSIFAAFAIAQLNKVANACWREYSGVDYLSAAQLCDRCNAFVTSHVANKFDNRFIIIPEATVTDLDSLRGFSWTLPIKIGVDNMRTVMTTYVEAYRKADLSTETTA